MRQNKLVAIYICIIYMFLNNACFKSKCSFDFSLFEQQGLTSSEKMKYLTYVNVTGNNFSVLDLICNWYSEDLEIYLNSQTLDILFIIETDRSDSSKVQELLGNWCFEKYIITYNTPNRFKTEQSQGVTAISFLYDKHGNEIALTNPTLHNFHKLLNQ